jgi:hypothetical protein
LFKEGIVRKSNRGSDFYWGTLCEGMDIWQLNPFLKLTYANKSYHVGKNIKPKHLNVVKTMDSITLTI